MSNDEKLDYPQARPEIDAAERRSSEGADGKPEYAQATPEDDGSERPASETPTDAGKYDYPQASPEVGSGG